MWDLNRTKSCIWLIFLTRQSCPSSRSKQNLNECLSKICEKTEGEFRSNKSQFALLTPNWPPPFLCPLDMLNRWTDTGVSDLQHLSVVELPSRCLGSSWLTTIPSVGPQNWGRSRGSFRNWQFVLWIFTLKISKNRTNRVRLATYPGCLPSEAMFFLMISHVPEGLGISKITSNHQNNQRCLLERGIIST